MVTLRLNCEPVVITKPDLTLAALLPFAEHCPNLQELELYIDATAVYPHYKHIWCVLLQQTLPGRIGKRLIASGIDLVPPRSYCTFRGRDLGSIRSSTIFANSACAGKADLILSHEQIFTYCNGCSVTAFWSILTTVRG